MVELAKIRRVQALDYPRILPDLSAVLCACVEAGASVGFMLPMTRAKARAFWLQVGAELPGGARIQLVAQEPGGRILGTVQLVFARPENQPHRADVSKLLVHPEARRQGLGERLMREIERLALAEGRNLLVLDTASADAERLYRRLGWQVCGPIPRYALLPAGEPCATVLYYKDLRG